MLLSLSGNLGKLGRWSAMAFLGALLGAEVHGSELFSESWESYTNNVTPYGGWKLDKGSWGKISSGGPDGGKCYFFTADPAVRIRHKVDLTACEDIVVQGWIYDSGDATSRSVLGLTDEDSPLGKFSIRMGIGDPKIYKTYIIVFNDPLQSKDLIPINTKLPLEKGWHFMRLEILHDRTVNYQVWSVDQSVKKTGTFGWIFDKSKFNFVSIASVVASTGSVGWDEIKVGAMEDVGPPQPLDGAARVPVIPKEADHKSKEGDLQLWLKFEDDGALSTADSSANKLSADLRGGASIGKVDGHAHCLDLDGSEGYLELPAGFDDFSRGMAVAFWARPTKEMSWSRFLDLGNGDGKDNIILTRVEKSSDLALVVYQGDGASSLKSQVIATNALDNLQWQHLAVSMEASGRVKFYKNGSLISEGTCAIPKAVKRTNNFVGRSNVDGSAFYAGQVGDVRIYNRPLREEEIAKLAKGKSSARSAMK